jgi:Legionella pneumophila major outer membrane protein precursor
MKTKELLLNFKTLSMTILATSSLFADEFDDLFFSHSPLITDTQSNTSQAPIIAAAPQAHSSTNSTASDDPNPSARFGTKRPWNFFVEGEVIWFKPLNSEFRNVKSNLSMPYTEYDFFDFDFQPGVRASLGWNTNYDGWDLQLIYTGLSYEKSHPYYSNIIDYLPQYFAEGMQTYSYYFNQGDLELGKMFKISKGLLLRPHVAFRSLWLTQKNSLFTTYSLVQGINGYSDFTVSNLYDISKIQSYFAGLNFGLDGMWRFTRSFSLITDISFQGLVNNTKRSLKQNLKGQPTDFSRISNMYHNGIFGYDIRIGFQWDKNFAQDKVHLGLKIAYEQYSLINLNQPLENAASGDGFFTSGQTQFLRPLNDDDFTLMGISLGARLDF